MTATPTGRPGPGERPASPTAAAAAEPGPVGRGAGPGPGTDCHQLACSFPLCEWPWCDDDVGPAAQDEGWDVESWDEEGGDDDYCNEFCDDGCTECGSDVEAVVRRTLLLLAEGPVPGCTGALGCGCLDVGPRQGPPADRGGATVEAAVALSALIVVLILGIAAIVAVVTQIRLVDAAGAAARLAARGDTASAGAAVDRLAPDGVRSSIRRGAEWTTVSLDAPAVPLLPGLRLSADAVAATEGTADEP